MVGDGLRPADGRRVLRADVARHRENDRAVPVRKIADDSDIASVAESARFSERSGERVFESEAECEEQWPGPVICAGGVVLVVEERTEDYLREAVTAG